MDQSVAPLGPGDLPQLFNILQGALSPDPATQKAAEQVLQTLETRQGYCSCLAEVVTTPAAPRASRWLAVTQLKNTITKQWRSRSHSVISDGEKAHLRSKVISLIPEEDNQIAVQVAVIFAKLAHFEYPTAWPSLMSDLLTQLSTPSVAAQRRVYLILHHVIKELAAKRLAADQQVFAQVSQQLFGDAWRQWSAEADQLLSHLSECASQQQQQLSPQAQPTLERWTLLLKIVRRLLVYGYPSDAKTVQQVGPVAQVAPTLMAHVQKLCQLLPRTPPRGQQQYRGTETSVRAVVCSCAVRIVKAMCRIQEHHPWSFHHCGTLIPFLDFTAGRVCLTNRHTTPAPSDTQDLNSEMLLLHCLLFITGVLTCHAYRGKTSSILLTTAGAKLQADTIKAAATEVQKKLAAFWTPERLTQLVNVLVETHFILTGGDVDEWHSDGEQFHHDMDTLSSSGNERLRPAAENLVLTLLKNHQPVVSAAVVEMLQRANEACPLGFTPAGGQVHGSFPAAVLYKEAVYTSAAVGADYLMDALDFKSWLASSLCQEAACEADWLKPVRRRSLLLIGQWVKEVPRVARGDVYRVVVGALGSSDVVVQLAAVRALHNLADDFDFHEEDFQCFLGSTFQLLASLLRNTTALDSHTQVFNLLNVFIERMGVEVRQYAGALMQLLPAVWESNTQQPLLRVQVLVALCALMNVLGAQCPAAYPVVLPLLQCSTDVHQPDHLMMLEDGLHLLIVTLRNAPTPYPPLLDLAPNLTSIIQASTEHIVPVTSVLVSSVLLGGGQFLSSHGTQVVAVLQTLIGNVNERGMKLLLPVMDVILQSFPTDGAALLDGPLQCLLRCVTSGTESEVVVAASMNVFSRLLLHSPTQWMSFFDRSASAVHVAAQAPPPQLTPGQQLTCAFVDLWMDKFDMIGSAACRKLNALAACVLPTLPSPPLLQRLESIVANVVSVVYEEQDEDANNGGRLRYDYRSFTSFSSGESYGGDAEDSVAVVNSLDAEGEVYRRTALADQDPVNNIKVKDFLKQQLNSAAALHGPLFHEVMSSMDPSVAQQLQQAVGT